ncbi:G2/M phase-specific E3 ubiquitin-protein ligase [Anthophora plagiata]
MHLNLESFTNVLLSSNMEQRGNDNQGILGFMIVDIKKEILRGKKLSCSYCKKKGATLGCCNTKCKKIFHYPCGLRAGTLNQFFGEFRSFCVKHRPKQKIDIQATRELASTKEVTCYICYEQVDPHDTINTIWAPCCKKNAWFHRKCVQQLAMSAGYFFKCPLCNDKTTFPKAMLEFGIFIPSQDASWELVPNAFQELLYRHDKCDAPVCLCPKGRNHTSLNAKWELVLCRICGSQGIHMACGQLKWANPVWECTECISILGKSKEIPGSSTTRNLSKNDSESEDVDIDIFVDEDSPIPFKSSSPITTSISQMSTIRQRPGPRTFKLKQLKASREMQVNNNRQASENPNDTFYSPTAGEQNLQSTSSTKICINESKCLLTDKMLHDCKDNFDSSTEYPKLRFDKSADNVITFDTDDDIIEISDCKELDDTFIIIDDDDDETERNDSFQTKNNIIEINRTGMLHESTALRMEKLSEENNLNKIGSNDSFISNLNRTETDSLKKINSRNKIKSGDFERSMKLNQETDVTCADSISNIKIVNVMSLAPQEFENVPSTERKQKITDTDHLTFENNNELLSSNTVLHSLLSQNSIIESNLKRKLDKSILSIPLKKIKRTDTILDENPSQSFLSGRDIEIANISRNDNTSVNNHNLQKLESRVQNCNIDESVLHATGTKYSLKVNKSSNAVCSKSNTFASLTNYKEKNQENTRIANDMNEIDKNMKNCDGDAGTTHIASKNTDITSEEARIDSVEKCVEPSYSRSKKPEMAKKWKTQNDIEFVIPQYRTSNAKSKNSCHQETDEDIECNYSRLIPEYIRLRDLKFRIHNLNNLQMILYDKYLVNINMENAATVTKNTKPDASMKKTTQQNRISPNFRSENILQNISSTCNKDKNKCTFVKEQSENYQDDTKENLDPVTIPCKTITDNLLTNATSITSNSNVSTNSNNQSENENLTQPMSETFEDTIIVQNNEDISLMNNTEGSVATTSYNNRYNDGVNINRNIRNFHSDCMTNSTLEIHGMKIGLRNESVNTSTKLIRRTLFLENHMNHKSMGESDTITEADLKISIELKKIRNFINKNPDLFPKYRTRNNELFFQQADFSKEENDVEECNLSEGVSSMTQESKNLQNFALTSGKNMIAELNNQNNENNLRQQRKYINYSSNGKKCNLLKCTCARIKK